MKKKLYNDNLRDALNGLNKMMGWELGRGKCFTQILQFCCRFDCGHNDIVCDNLCNNIADHTPSILTFESEVAASLVRITPN